MAVARAGVVDVGGVNYDGGFSGAVELRGGMGLDTFRRGYFESGVPFGIVEDVFLMADGRLESVRGECDTGSDGEESIRVFGRIWVLDEGRGGRQSGR